MQTTQYTLGEIFTVLAREQPALAAACILLRAASKSFWDAAARQSGGSPARYHLSCYPEQARMSLPRNTRGNYFKKYLSDLPGLTQEIYLMYENFGQNIPEIRALCNEHFDSASKGTVTNPRSYAFMREVFAKYTKKVPVVFTCVTDNGTLRISREIICTYTRDLFGSYESERDKLVCFAEQQLGKNYTETNLCNLYEFLSRAQLPLRSLQRVYEVITPEHLTDYHAQEAALIILESALASVCDWSSVEDFTAREYLSRVSKYKFSGEVYAAVLKNLRSYWDNPISSKLYGQIIEIAAAEQ